MDVDDPLPPSSAPETPIQEASPNGVGLHYPHTPCSTRDGSSVPCESPKKRIAHTSSFSLVSTTLAHDSTSARNASQSEGSPSDAFRTLTPPPSSDMDIAQEEPRFVQVLDVKSKTEKLIADIRAQALAAVHSSPEQSPVDLDDLSDSDSDSDIDDVCDNFAAKLIKEADAQSKSPA